jgi:serine/threonine-protein kinase
LAFGGLSAIYLAHLNKTDLVVLKEAVVHAKADPAAKHQAEQHLEREAKMLSTLKHPNIARVLDHFVEDERHYLILEYISGQDLRQYVKQNEGQEVETVVDWAIDAATILAFLHANDPPVIHRDLTPDNLVVRNDGALILIDFGAANQFVGSATGTVVGKQAYIAPEQLRGKTVTQSDLYSLGGTIYYLLTGRDPMPLSISRPKTLRHDTPEALDELVAKLSAFEPEERVQAAAEVVDQLKIIKASLTGRDVVATGEVS